MVEKSMKKNDEGCCEERFWLEKVKEEVKVEG